MKLTFINGSPRGRSSNTKILLDHFLSGFRSVDSTVEFESLFLNNPKSSQEAVREMEESDIVILAFPLYTDSMPGIVKAFIEALDPATFRNKKLKLGFVVQSGFPEAVHSDHVKRYLEKWSSRLGVDCLGTMVRGGVEGLKIQPRWMTRYTDLFYEQGQYLALEWKFSNDLIKKLRKPDRLRGFRLFIFRLMKATGLANYYWNSQLKENHAYDNRYAKPYSS